MALRSSCRATLMFVCVYRRGGSGSGSGSTGNGGGGSGSSYVLFLFSNHDL